MSAAAFLGRIPVPLFGTTRVIAAYGQRVASHTPSFAKGWTFPALVGATWFIWPAVDDEWKMEMGFISNPEEEAAAPAAAPVKLDAAGEAAVAVAHKGGELTEEEVKVMAQVKAGDYAALEKDWDEFYAKSIKPGEDDDDDDEDDEDDEDEEEEEEDEEEEE